jgi:hypothetical protein
LDGGLAGEVEDVAAVECAHDGPIPGPGSRSRCRRIR